MIAANHEHIFDSLTSDIAKLLETHFGTSTGAGPAEEAADAPSEDDTDKAAIGACYLGNWLSDMSQLVDPQHALRIMGFLTTVNKEWVTSVDDVFPPLIGLVNSAEASLLKSTTAGYPRGAKFVAPLVGDLLQVAQKAIKTLMAHIRSAITAIRAAVKSFMTFCMRSGQSLARRFAATQNKYPLKLNEAARALMSVVGAFKFKNGYGFSNADTALATVSANLGVYRAYEHLDWSLNLANLKKDKVEGLDALAQYRRQIEPKVASDVSPDIMKSLSEDVAIAFERLRLLAATGQNPDAENPQKLDKNSFLVKLGLSLHAVEDYFAHTNFIDHVLFRESIAQNDLFSTDLPAKNFQHVKLMGSVLKEATFVELRKWHNGFDLTDVAVCGKIANGIERVIKPSYFHTNDIFHSLAHVIGHTVLDGATAPYNSKSEDRSNHHLSVLNMFERVNLRQIAQMEKPRATHAREAFIENQKGQDGAPYSANTLNQLSPQTIMSLFTGTALGKDLADNTDTLATIAVAVNKLLEISTVWAISAEARNDNSGIPVTGFDHDQFLENLDGMSSFMNNIGFLLGILADVDSVKDRLKDLIPSLPTELLDYLLEPQRTMLRQMSQGIFNYIYAYLNDKAAFESHSLAAKDDKHKQDGLYHVAENFAKSLDHAILNALSYQSSDPSVDVVAERINRLNKLERAILFDPLADRTYATNGNRKIRFEGRKARPYLGAAMTMDLVNESLLLSAKTQADSMGGTFSLHYRHTIKELAAWNAKLFHLVRPAGSHPTKWHFVLTKQGPLPDTFNLWTHYTKIGLGPIKDASPVQHEDGDVTPEWFRNIARTSVTNSKTGTTHVDPLEPYSKIVQLVDQANPSGDPIPPLHSPTDIQAIINGRFETYKDVLTHLFNEEVADNDLGATTCSLDYIGEYRWRRNDY